MQDDTSRFWSYVAVREADACWPWQGHRTDRGYGVFWFDGKNIRAHRYACELEYGLAPSSEHFALHSCDNSPCCNPRHLRWGTALDNTADKLERTGTVKGSGNPNAAITESQAARIYRLRLEGWTVPEIASEMSLSKALVMNVYTGKSWSHLLGVDGNPTLTELRVKRRLRTRRISPNRVLTDAMVDHILQARAAGRSGKDIAAEMKLPLGTISPVFSGLTFTHRLGVDGNPTFEQLRSVRAVGSNIKLTEDDVAEIRALLKQGYASVSLATHYGVSTATISNIKAGKR